MGRNTKAIGRSRAAFASRLKRLRLQAELTQKDLEKVSGIPKSRISRYENGHLLPSFEGLRRLAGSLGVSDSALFADGDEPFVIFVAALRRHGIEFESVEHAEELARVVAETIAGEHGQSPRRLSG